jgi:ADP-heptose:LPS heptosyltransferase
MSLVTALLWLLGRLGRLGAEERPVRRILVFGYAAIGDLVFLLPTLAALRRHYPQARVTFLANATPVTSEIMPATGFVDDIWLCDWEGPGGESRQGEINRRIHQAGFDLALLSLSAPAHYFQWGLRAVPCRAGHCREAAAALGVQTWPRDAWRWLRWALITGELARRTLLNRVAWIAPGPEHSVSRNLRILDALGIPKPPAAQPPALPLSAAHRAFAQQALSGLDPAKNWIGVNMGTLRGQYQKNWLPARFAEFLRLMAGIWPSEFICLGSTDEQEAVDLARKSFPALHSLAGKSSILEAYAVLERCDLFVNSDSGLAVAAMAMGIPTATLWGPADPLEVGPIWDADRHLSVRAGWACSPCTRFGMAKGGPGSINYRTCGHHDCLNQLSADFVLEAIRRKFAGVLANPVRRARQRAGNCYP